MAIEILTFLPYLAAMAGVTYLTRSLPFIFVRKKFKNRFIISLGTYIPYAVLAVMTFPSAFFSTGNTLSGVVAVGVAMTAAFLLNNQMVVALSSVIAALAVELIQLFVNGGI